MEKWRERVRVREKPAEFPGMSRVTEGSPAGEGGVSQTTDR